MTTQTHEAVLTFGIEKFNPTKAEILRLVDQCKGLTIIDIHDKVGYEMVDAARKQLKSTRVEIEKAGKAMREEAIRFQKQVIGLEKELVEMIEPLEKELEQKQKAIKLQQEMEKRKEFLPARMAQLAEIEVKADENEILAMDDVKFNQFISAKQSLYIQEQQRRAHEQQEKLEAEKRKLEDEKRKLEEEKIRLEREQKHQEELEKTRKEAEKKAKADYELKLAKEKEAAEKAKIKAEEAEKARIAAEDARKEQEAKALEAQKKYQSFLAGIGYDRNDEDFFIRDIGNFVMVYKKLGTYNRKTQEIMEVTI